jgi:hypothetical protein
MLQNIVNNFGFSVGFPPLPCDMKCELLQMANAAFDMYRWTELTKCFEHV